MAVTEVSKSGSGLEVRVLTPSKTLMSATADQVLVPGVLGYMGLLPGHASIVAQLKPGIVAIDKVGGAGRVEINSSLGGFVEVIGNRVSVLLDRADLS